MDKNNTEHIVNIDQLPDDPLKMPPPYWRSNGAIFHLFHSVEDIGDLLHDLIPIHAETEEHLIDYYEKYPEYHEDDDEALEEFSDITEDISVHEHRIHLKIEIACLMSAIEAEDEINRFCVSLVSAKLARQGRDWLACSFAAQDGRFWSERRESLWVDAL